MTNRKDTIAFCAAAELLLKEHAADDQLTGRAREDAQRELGRIAYPTLVWSVEKIQNLVIEIEQLREVMPCGHPAACLVGADAERDSTVSCDWCNDRAQWGRFLEVAEQNAEGYRELLVESERKVMELETEIKLNASILAQQCDLAREAETMLSRERMRATSRAGSVPK